MTQQPSVIETYRELFSKTISNDPNDQTQALLQIEEAMTKENRPDFIFSCFCILQNYKDLDEIFIKQTILYLNMAFSPDNDEQLISNIWKIQWRTTEHNNPNAKQNSELKNGIKNICLELFRYPNEVIQQLSSECLSRISIYDRGNFQNTLAAIISILVDKDLEETIDTRFASLCSLSLFFTYSKIHREDDLFEFEDDSFYGFLLDGSIEILSSYNLYSEQFIKEMLQMLSSFIYVSPKYFLSLCLTSTEEIKEQNRGRMKLLFEGIKEIVRNNSDNENILGPVHNFFFSFFEVIYDQSIYLAYNDKQSPEEKEKNLSGYAEELQLLFNEYIIQINFPLILPSTNASYIAIDFWNEIGKFEKKRVKINNVIDKYYESLTNYELNTDKYGIRRMKGFSKSPIFYVLHQFQSQLMPMMLQSMEYINQEEQNVDDTENQYNSPYNFAALVVKRFFYFDSETTFRYISDYFEKTLSLEQVEWNIRNAQMLLISCICKLSKNEIILGTIQQFSELMIQTIFQFKDNNAVLVSTLQALSIAFHNYNLFMNEELVLQLLNYVFNLCNETGSQKVILNSILLIKEIICCFDKEDTENKINIIIPPVKEFLVIVSGKEDFAYSNYLRDFYSLKETIIDHNNPGTNNELIIQILSDSYQFCMENPISDMFFGELHVFSFIMNLYGDHFVDNGLNMSAKLIEFLNGSNPTITVECLTCLIKIVSNLGENCSNILPQLKEQIGLAFESECPEIIIQVSRLLGSLFAKTGPLMYDVLEVSVDKISQQISKALSGSEYAIYFSNQIHYLIKPLAKILDSIPREEPICLHIRDQLLPIFYCILNTYKSKDKFENESFLKAMVMAYRSIVDASEADVLFLRKHKKEVFKIITVLNDNDLPLSDKVLYKYCDFISSCINVMKKDRILRVILCNSSNIKPFIWAESSNDDNLKDQATAFINYLLNKSI